MKIKHMQDPGHGWFAVKRKVLEFLGILEKISPHSYQNGGMVYLEEDRDAGIFIEALKAKGIEYTLESKHTDRRSPIRSYQPFNAQNPPLSPKNILPGMKVECYGRIYTVAGVKGKSFVIKSEEGAFFKASVQNIGRIVETSQAS